MNIKINIANLRITYISLLSLICLTTSNIGAMGSFNLKDCALPKNSIRTKLDSIFKSGKSLETDPMWKDLGSEHWLVGKLTTAGRKTEFVVKAANHPAGEEITLSNGVKLTHSAQQNISRLKEAHKANTIIKDNNLNNIRTPDSYAYPISGNNDDLSNPAITDNEVIIVEEMVKRKSNNTIPLPINPAIMIQSETLELDQQTYNQLVTVVEKGKFLDQTPNNYLVDEQGKVVLIDLEDILELQKETVENSNPLARPLKRHKLNCLRDGNAKILIGLTGALNTKDPQINLQGKKLQINGLRVLYIKKIAFEIGAVTATIAAVTALTTRRLYYVSKTNKQIQKCRKATKRAIRLQLTQCNVLPDKNYIKTAENEIKKILPKENRKEIFEAFAVIAIAETSDNLHIFGKEYQSSQEAIRKSRRTIYSTWKSDWSIPSKIVRGTKATAKGIALLAKKMSNSGNNKTDKLEINLKLA